MTLTIDLEGQSYSYLRRRITTLIIMQIKYSFQTYIEVVVVNIWVDPPVVNYSLTYTLK